MIRNPKIDYASTESICKLLRGVYVDSLGGMMGGIPVTLPVNPGLILRNYIYEHPECKESFQKALLVLGNGSAGDVYLCFHYFHDCLLFEDVIRTASFRINQELFRPLLKKQLRRYDKELRGKITFWNDLQAWNPMEHIEEFNEDFKNDYGFSLL